MFPSLSLKVNEKFDTIVNKWSSIGDENNHKYLVYTQVSNLSNLKHTIGCIKN